MIRVVIADDHHLVRQGLRALLESNPEVKVIGEAATGFEAVEQAEKLMPDVIVMDLSMPRLDGVQAAARILELNAPIQIVIVSMHADTAVIQNLVRRGVKGYLLKDALADELMLAIRSAAAGKLYLSPVSYTHLDVYKRQVIGEAATGFEAVEQAEKLTPDVIVMDLSMPRLDGVQAAVSYTHLDVYKRQRPRCLSCSA